MLILAHDKADDGEEADWAATVAECPPLPPGPGSRRSDDLEFFVGAGLATLASAAFWGTVLYGLAALLGLAG